MPRGAHDPHDTSRISPTAHYTGAVWLRNGLSHPALGTREGALLYRASDRLIRAVAQLTRGPTLEQMLLARHRIIDQLLVDAIERDGVAQVVEIAGGLSARGLRFVRRYPGLRYVEGDLPGMVKRKRAALERIGEPLAGHTVATLNALEDDGPRSLAAVAGPLLDKARPTAIITEGLLNYFSREQVLAMLARFARFLAGFPGGVYLADLHLDAETLRHLGARMFVPVLQWIARGKIHLHFTDDAEAAAAIAAQGFDQVTLHRPKDWASRVATPKPRGPDVVRILEARVGAR